MGNKPGEVGILWSVNVMGTGISQIRLGEGRVTITDSLVLTSKQRTIVTKKISFWPLTSQRFDDCSNYLSHCSSDLNY